jgi:hypothetical protein
MAENQDPQSPLEEPEKVIDEIAQSLDELHAKYAAVTVVFGEDKERMESLRSTWRGLANSTTNDPSQVHIYASGVHVLQAYRDDLVQFKQVAIPLADQVLAASPSSDTAVAVTNTSLGFVRPTIVPGLPSALLEPRWADTEQVLHVLASIDQSLSDTYSAIREVLYGTRSDPERAALYLLRQTFDHFFRALAPNDAVRDSRFFKAKEPPKEAQVHRHERLMYAAHTHIINPSRRTSLVASFRHMLDVYDALNDAHADAKIDPATARAALTEMLTLLQDWARAYGESQSA